MNTERWRDIRNALGIAVLVVLFSLLILKGVAGRSEPDGGVGDIRKDRTTQVEP